MVVEADQRGKAPFRLGYKVGLPAHIWHLRIFAVTHIVLSVNALREFKAQIFQALAHPTRIAVLEALRERERSAGDLLAELGLEQANLSQHFAVLRAKHVVLTRKAGNQVHYRLRDPVLTRVLDLLKEYFHGHISGTAALLADLEPSKPRKARPRRNA
jgi:DNA-binding transcriptional ArsR family regulator